MSRNKNKQSFLQTRRFKYGSAAAALTVVVIALIIVVNVIFTAFAAKYRWYADMTATKLYELSEGMISFMDDVKDTKISIIFCTPFDKLEENVYQKIVYTTALNLQNRYDWIDVSYIDIITDPGSFKPYKTTEASTIKTTSVIITNGSDFRVFAIEAFYTFAQSDNSVFAYNGEYKIVSAILQMEGEHPIAYFTTGHSETVEKTALWALFEEAGFDTRTIDLVKEDIDPAAKIVIINGPLYDFGGYKDDVNEIAKLDRFVDDRGSLMVFVNPETQELPELEEYLSEWGITFGKAVIRDYSNSVSTDGTALVSVYPTEGLGASLHKNIRDLESQPKTIMRDCQPINLLWEKEEAHNSRRVSTILTTTDQATAYSTSDGQEIGKGPFNTLVLSSELQYILNDEMFTYVMVGGTSQFGSDAYINSNTYGNRDIMYSAMKALGKDKVPLELDFKLFEDNSLDLTTAEATRWTVIFTFVMPVIVSAVGIGVWVKRRHA
jgi:hypothetical protein